jgi:hypothetical protein
MDNLDDDAPKKASKATIVRRALVWSLALACAGGWIYTRYLVKKSGLGGACSYDMHCLPEAPAASSRPWTPTTSAAARAMGTRTARAVALPRLTELVLRVHHERTRARDGLAAQRNRICTGTEASSRDPLPSWEASFLPQQRT